MSQKMLDTKTETEIVAYIARGDDYNTILKMLHERGVDVTKATISNIKKRNPEALKFMQDTLTEQTFSHSTSILRKSRQLLENKLDEQEDLDKRLGELKEKYDKEEITLREYIDMSELLIGRKLTAKDLNSITKESFNQSQVEQGKPSAITENPTQARANLQRVLSAIASGDEEAVIKSLFIDA